MNMLSNELSKYLFIVYYYKQLSVIKSYIHKIDKKKKSSKIKG